MARFPQRQGYWHTAGIQPTRGVSLMFPQLQETSQRTVQDLSGLESQMPDSDELI